MNELYKLHLQKLERFMEEVRMTPEQKIELYSLAESFLSDGILDYKIVKEFSRELVNKKRQIADLIREYTNSCFKSFENDCI